MTKLRVLITKLIREADIPKKHQAHPLRGKWKGYRDAHIEPDWLLIYRIVGNNLQLVRTGTHADLFQ